MPYAGLGKTLTVFRRDVAPRILSWRPYSKISNRAFLWLVMPLAQVGAGEWK